MHARAIAGYGASNVLSGGEEECVIGGNTDRKTSSQTCNRVSSLRLELE